MDRRAAGDEADAVGDRAQYRLARGIEIFAPRQYVGALLGGSGLDEAGGRGVQRAHQRLDRAAARFDDVAAHGEDLLDAAPPDLSGGERDMAGAAIDRDRIPRLADANAVDLAPGRPVGPAGRGGNDDIDHG